MNWDALIEDGMKFLGVAALVLVNGFFVAAELAFVRIRDTQLDALAAKLDGRAQDRSDELAEALAAIRGTD